MERAIPNPGSAFRGWNHLEPPQVESAVQQGLGDLLNSAQTAPNSAGAPSHVEGARVFGVTLIGATSHNLHKLLLTVAFIAIAWVLAWAIRQILKLFIGSRTGTRFQFWAKQGVSLVVAAILILGILSIWFDNPTRLAGALGLIGAGIAFALQRVITAVAGYFVILRGKTFNVGDRILMGGVRGDVVGLSFMQTRIMEMGQSPREETDTRSWVRSRQFTGRIVTVTNDKVFDEPVFNYTHEFAYIWDEVSVPVRYSSDYGVAEKCILAAAAKHALSRGKIGDEEVRRIEQRFGVDIGEIDPRVFWRITEDWLEMTVRFLGPDHGIRGIKDKMTRAIIQAFEDQGVGVGATRQEAVTADALRDSGLIRPAN
jgi:small-conductance mechanosensitive channel